MMGSFLTGSRKKLCIVYQISNIMHFLDVAVPLLWSVRPIIVGSVANLARGQVCVYRVGLEEELESKLS